MGAIGHGKTSLAQAFLRQVSPAEHTESSILIAKVADQLTSTTRQPSRNLTIHQALTPGS